MLEQELLSRHPKCLKMNFNEIKKTVQKINFQPEKKKPEHYLKEDNII